MLSVSAKLVGEEDVVLMLMLMVQMVAMVPRMALLHGVVSELAQLCTQRLQP